MNPAGRHEWVVEPAHAGQRLDLAMVEQMAPAGLEISRARAQALISEGEVTLNGAPTKASAKLRAGDRVHVHIPPPRPVSTGAEEIPLNVLFEDAHLIVLNKPAGLVVHPGAGNMEHTLVNALLHHCAGNLSGIGGEERPGIVHRLDKDTSGVMVAAKDDAAHRALAAQFAGRQTFKEYLAVIKGVPAQAVTEIQFSIQRHPMNRKKMQALTPKIKAGPDARAAHTTCTLLEVGPEREISLVRCRLHTGRTHQIRVHMAAIGHPLVGDTLYGGPTRAGAGRQLLHAWKLGFQHPITLEKCQFLAAPPPDILAEFPGVKLA